MLTRIAVHEPATDGGKGLSLLISIPTLPDIEKQNRVPAANLTTLQLYVSWLPYPLKSRCGSLTSDNECQLCLPRFLPPMSSGTKRDFQMVDSKMYGEL